MGFKELYLYNFRNFESLRIDLDYPEVYFVGKNGQGKTNILEALYFLCYGSSFRTKHDNIILKHKQNQMAAAAKFEKNDNSLNKISIQLDKGQKKIIYNDKIITDRRDIMLNMPCIVFCHGDLDFVVGSPDKKRNFFDQTLSLLDSDFIVLLRNYKNILKNRNKLLKEASDIELIKIYTEKLVDYGILLQNKRNNVIKQFNIVISEMFNNISDLNGKLNIDYISSWKTDNKEEIVNSINNKINYELKMKTSCYGPHRDNFKFIYEKKDFNEFASTGQLRLVSLILRAAQGIFFSDKTGRKPILLLDDVLLELDNEKRELFMNNLPEYEQAFYTFLPDSSALKKHEAKVFYIIEGNLTE
ncbi:MAG: DNA replication and repair protein RecF [Spirochaetaceae bacterium]